jgi:2-hydroxy-3-keto-5-methylthiopentenyl-1-phosphate phosphatase
MSLSAAYVVDFDGTITTKDISSELAAYFGGSGFMEVENRYEAGEIQIKEWLRLIAGFMPGDMDLLITKAFEWAAIRPGFERFLEQAGEDNCPVIIASDGFGFYIEPILEKYGLLDRVSRICRNQTAVDQDGTLYVKNPHAHPICTVCGNCKAAHVVGLKDEGRPVIYIGDGSNDRFGASWSDQIFSRDRLTEICREKNFSYSPWTDFYDIINVEKPRLYDRSEISLCCPMGSGIKE